MGIIILSEAKKRAAEIAAFAEKTENWYLIGASTFVPGYRDEYTLLSGDHRAVFTWTVLSTAEVVRHLSVSVPRPGRYPQLITIWTLAHYFGFTGAKVDPESDTVREPAADWVAGVNEGEGTFVVYQDVKDSP
jgi:hypothetical protein